MATEMERLPGNCGWRHPRARVPCGPLCQLSRRRMSAPEPVAKAKRSAPSLPKSVLRWFRLAKRGR